MVTVSATMNGVDYVGSLDFQYLQERTVSSMFPSSGPINGGSDVYFFGTGFDEIHDKLQRLSMLPFCRFGNVEVPAKILNSSALVCTSPPIPSGEAEIVETSISLRYTLGKEITFKSASREATLFQYYSVPAYHHPR